MKINRRFLIALAAWLAVALYVIPAHAEKSVTDPAQLITPKSFLSHIEYLASDELKGRDTGSEGLRMAADYIVKRLKQWGVAAPFDNGSYFQHFLYKGRASVGEKSSLVLERNGWKKRFILGRDFTPMNFSKNGSASGKLVFAGYGITAPEKNYDDYAGINAEGKVLIIMRHTPWENRRNRHAHFSTKVEVALRNKAAGIVFVTDPKSAGDSDDLMSEVGRGSYDIPIFHAKIAAMDFLLPDGSGLRDLQKKIDESGNPASFEIEGVSANLTADLTREGIVTENVIGVIEGSDPKLKNEFVVLGAHYDHVGVGTRGRDKGKVFNGADDNASGSAAILEIAHAVSRMAVKPKRTLVFIWFSGEEKGLLGSRHYVENPVFPLEDTSLLINIDMCGRSKTGSFWLGGVGTAEGLRKLCESVLDKTNAAPRMSEQSTRQSDNASFERKNIPNLFVNSGMHDDLHRPTDTVDKINAETGAEITRMMLHIALGTANREGKFQYKRPKRGRRQGRGVYMGVADMEVTKNGLEVRKVAPHSPCHAAGMEDGDVIQEIDGKACKTYRDLTGFLRGKKPGDEIEVTVMRDGKKMVLTVKLGNRPG